MMDFLLAFGPNWLLRLSVMMLVSGVLMYLICLGMGFKREQNVGQRNILAKIQYN